MYGILYVHYEGQSETSKLVPCVTCGMYSLFNSENYVLFESINTINNDGTIHYTCHTCKDKISMSYQIEDLNKKVTKLRERVASLKLIRNIENEIDNSANNMLGNSVLTNKTTDDLATEFANLSLSSNIPLPNNNITIEQSISSNLDNGDASYTTSVWDSEPSSTISFDYSCPMSNVCELPNDTQSSIHAISTELDSTHQNDISTHPSDGQNTDENTQQKHISESLSAMESIDTVMISDSFLSGIEFPTGFKVKGANYPSAKIENVTKTIKLFSSKYDKLNYIIVHTGTNDIRYGMKTEEVKKSFRYLYQTTQKLHKELIISGPVPIVNCSGEHYSRTAALNAWLKKWCLENKINFVNNFETEWKNLNLYNHDKKKLNYDGKQKLIQNIDEVYTKLCTN